MFAYLSHSTQYAGTRILSFVGECDDSFNCSWPAEGQGQYDHSADFVASQSFDDPRGRRVLMGWVGGPHGKRFTGAQSIPRMIVADSGGPLRFLPLPELTSLHTNSQNFSDQFSEHKSMSHTVKGVGISGDGKHGAQSQAAELKQQQATNGRVLVASTTNSYHLNVSFDITKLATHSRIAGNASIEVRIFVPRAVSSSVQTDTDGLTVFTLRPPWSYVAQKVLPETSLVGDILVCTSSIEPIR